MTKYNVGDTIYFDLDLGAGIEKGTIKVIRYNRDIDVVRAEDGEVWAIDESDIIRRIDIVYEEPVVGVDDVTISGDRDEVNKRLLFDNADMLEGMEKLKARVYKLLADNDQLEDEKGELQEEMEELNERSVQQMVESGALACEYRELEQENKTLMKVIQAIAVNK